MNCRAILVHKLQAIRSLKKKILTTFRLGHPLKHSWVVFDLKCRLVMIMQWLVRIEGNLKMSKGSIQYTSRLTVFSQVFVFILKILRFINRRWDDRVNLGRWIQFRYTNRVFVTFLKLIKCLEQSSRSQVFFCSFDFHRIFTTWIGLNCIKCVI